MERRRIERRSETNLALFLGGGSIRSSQTACTFHPMSSPTRCYGVLGRHERPGVLRGHRTWALSTASLSQSCRKRWQEASSRSLYIPF